MAVRDLLDLFAAHDFLLTRDDLLARGVPVWRLDEAVKTGRLIAVRRGVYSPAEFVAALEPRRAAPRHRARAASLAMRLPHVLSHDSAALELGIPLLRGRREIHHVTRPGVLGTRTEHGVKHHKAPYEPSRVLTAGRWRLLDAARTACDLAREHGLEQGLVAADAVRRGGVEVDDLAQVLALMRYWPGVSAVRAALQWSDPGAESPGESLTRLLLLELDLGLGRPQTQFGLTDGTRTVWCDLRVGRQVIEFDGAAKYVAAEHGGWAERPALDVLLAEKERQDFVTGFGLGVSRVVWGDLFGRRREQTARRLRREIARTSAALGTSIDDLARFRPPPHARRHRCNAVSTGSPGPEIGW